MKVDHDVVVIGAGAAGLTAAQYAARSNLRTLVIEELASGGQALIIDRLENYPGFPDPISGMELSQRMETQARNFGAEFDFATVTKISKGPACFTVDTSSGNLTSSAVILATGAHHRTLDVPGEKEFQGRGVSYCATCDGPLFKGKRMLVVGGGDAACDEANYLSKLSDKIIHIHRRDRFRAQKSLAARVMQNKHIDVRFNTECQAVLGNGRVTGVTLIDNHTHRVYEEAVEAVFVFIGSTPRTAFLEGVTVDESGYVVTDHLMETNLKGLFAVGDVRATPFRQLVVAAGEGAIAAHTAALYIDELKGEAYR
ncbi:MAG TPA: thioredoxin-disulfide reductase [Spirochaetia bacterium]|nr:thioredoxin-disulfide reductase [Spirochaetia bacterium]